jgi:response regulator of citrate/malate metabolism
MTTNTNTKRGRKPVFLDWPDTEFTAKEVASVMQGKLSRVSVHARINKAVESGEITIVRQKGGMGRPQNVYKKSSLGG